MKSIKDIYKTGRGPSSSHTMGPQFVAEYVLRKYGKGEYTVELLGSLALTGKGHGTDRVIKEVLGEGTRIVFNTTDKPASHPNELRVRTPQGELVTAVSVGGGEVIVNGESLSSSRDVYGESNFAEIKARLTAEKLTLADYVDMHEKDIDGYLLRVWQVMKNSVERGLNADGVLGGGLKLARKAKALYNENTKFEPDVMRENRKLSAYAFAVAEENADNGEIVTAPTCGSAGVLPAVLYYMYKDCHVSESEIICALKTAGIIGNVVKHNASISGAECGCQAEIGVACSMAAAALADIYGLDIDAIECSAEIALEHSLGLTCDPVLGLVQIPCIERNAVAGIKAVNAVMLAKSLSDKHKISFDEIVAVMYETGKDMNAVYRETAIGGLAKIYKP